LQRAVSIYALKQMSNKIPPKTKRILRETGLYHIFRVCRGSSGSGSLQAFNLLDPFYPINQDTLHYPSRCIRFFHKS
jgi:hypothetical protein